jgi:hypothetical protein
MSLCFLYSHGTCTVTPCDACHQEQANLSQVMGTGMSEVWTCRWCVTDIFCQFFSFSYSSFSLGVILRGQNQQVCLVELQVYSIQYKSVCVCFLCCGMCTGSTVAYWGSGRATVACNIIIIIMIIIIILPQNCCAVCRWSSSVGLVTKVQAGWCGAEILTGARYFFFLQHAQTGSGAHPIPSLLAVKWLGLQADHFYWVLILSLEWSRASTQPTCTGMTLAVLLWSVEPE